MGAAGDNVLNGGDGQDTIGDFSRRATSFYVIEFNTSQFGDFASVIAAAADDGTDTTISVNTDTSVILQNGLVAELHQDEEEIQKSEY